MPHTTKPEPPIRKVPDDKIGEIYKAFQAAVEKNKREGKFAREPKKKPDTEERLYFLGRSALNARIRYLAREHHRWFGQKPWWERNRLKALDLNMQIHGGRTGAGIMRPRERREGEAPYHDRTDAVARRWLPPPEGDDNVTG